MDRRLLFLSTVVVILLILFFYPKTNGVWDDTFTAQNAKQYKNMYCTCLGLTAMESGHSLSDTQVQLCYGLPVNCRYECKKVVDGTWQDIPCDKLG